MNFGDRIRQLRQDKGLTQPELADAMGIEQSYLSKLENSNIFNVPVEGGSRTYRLRGEIEIDPWQNKAITFVGVLMLVFGTIGLVLERKLSRYQ